MAVTRLGLSGTPRAAFTRSTLVSASLAQWEWTTYAATVAADRSVVANLAQWDWTPLAATVSVERSVTANLAQWEWTALSSSVALERAVQANLAQWEWTPLAATVSATGITAVVSGTAVTGLTVSDIQTGGKTIIITLTGGETWLAAGTPFDDSRAVILSEITGDDASATGWNAVVADELSVTDVVRTSSTVVTITLPAVPTYDAVETITVNVDGDTVTSGLSPTVVNDTFSIAADVTKIGDGDGTSGGNYGRIMPPIRKSRRTGCVTDGTCPVEVEDVSEALKELIASPLPDREVIEQILARFEPEDLEDVPLDFSEFIQALQGLSKTEDLNTQDIRNVLARFDTKEEPANLDFSEFITSLQEIRDSPLPERGDINDVLAKFDPVEPERPLTRIDLIEALARMQEQNLKFLESLESRVFLEFGKIRAPSEESEIFLNALEGAFSQNQEARDREKLISVLESMESQEAENRRKIAGLLMALAAA